MEREKLSKKLLVSTPKKEMLNKLVSWKKDKHSGKKKDRNTEH